jgi:hypothetical protein
LNHRTHALENNQETQKTRIRRKETGDKDDDRGGDGGEYDGK